MGGNRERDEAREGVGMPGLSTHYEELKTLKHARGVMRGRSVGGWYVKRGRTVCGGEELESVSHRRILVERVGGVGAGQETLAAPQHVCTHRPDAQPSVQVSHSAHAEHGFEHG